MLKEYWIIYTINSNNKDIDSNDLTWFHKIAALTLAKKCNEALYRLTTEGPSVMHVKLLEEIKLLEERLLRIEAREINR